MARPDARIAASALPWGLAVGSCVAASVLLGGAWLHLTLDRQADDQSRVLAQTLASALFAPVAEEDVEVATRLLAPLGDVSVTVWTGGKEPWLRQGGAEPARAQALIVDGGLELGAIEVGVSPTAPSWLALGMVALAAGLSAGLALGWGVARTRRRREAPLRRIARTCARALEDLELRAAGPHEAEQRLDTLLEQRQRAVCDAEARADRERAGREVLSDALASLRQLVITLESRLTGPLVLCDHAGQVQAISESARAWLPGEASLPVRWSALDPPGAKRLIRALSTPEEGFPARLRTADGTLDCTWEHVSTGHVLLLCDTQQGEQERLAALHRQGWVRLLEAALVDVAPVRVWLTTSRRLSTPLARAAGHHPAEVRSLARQLRAGAARWSLEDIVWLTEQVEEAARGGRLPARLRQALGEAQGDYLERLEALLGPDSGDLWVSLSDRLRWLASRSKRRGEGVSLHFSAPSVDIDALDWDPVETMLCALVDNAVRHARTDGGVRIRVQVTPGSHGCEVVVSDDGPGVDWSAVAARACDLGLPHVGTAELADALWCEGLSTSGDPGAGLALVRELASHGGGGVTLASDPGRGTAVTLSLSPITVRPSGRLHELGAV